MAANIKRHEQEKENAGMDQLRRSQSDDQEENDLPIRCRMEEENSKLGTSQATPYQPDLVAQILQHHEHKISFGQLFDGKRNLEENHNLKHIDYQAKGNLKRLPQSENEFTTRRPTQTALIAETVQKQHRRSFFGKLPFESSSRDVWEEKHLNELYRKDMRDHKHLSQRDFIAEAVMKQQQPQKSFFVQLSTR
jgi:hypothetical protein